MKTWYATLDIYFKLTEERIKKDPNHYGRFFKDINNPTEAEVRKYFEARQESYAGSNDGSELLANANMDIECIDEPAQASA